MSVTSIVLAAGRGTRMGRPDLPKVLFPVCGVPAVVRTLQTLSRCGVRRHVVVVGRPAGVIVDAVSSHCSNTAFVVQDPPNGTGDAARIGAEMLEDCSAGGSILVCAGDKYLEPSLVRRLLEVEVTADFALLTTPRSLCGADAEGGLVLRDSDGVPGCILELPDYLARITAVRVREVLSKGGDLAPVFQEAKQNGHEAPRFLRLLAEWARRAGAGAGADPEWRAELDRYAAAIPLGSGWIDPGSIELEGARLNASVYLIRADILFRLVQRLRSDNVQGEYYVTDLLRLCREHYPEARVVEVVQERAGEIMAYRNPQDLLQIERHVRGETERACVLRMAARAAWAAPISRWETALTDPRGTGMDEAFSDIYGRRTGPEGVLELLGRFRDRFGDSGEVLVVRSPARINLMGRHIDHQGGPINVMAINREVWMVARPREDDCFRLASVDSDRFPDRSFSVGELVSKLPWESWLETIRAPRTSELVARLQGDWGHYARAAALRLQSRFRDRVLHGADIVVGGNIPTGAGLSSSSAMVVAFAELIIGMNHLEVESRELVDYCGEGEWFVGTRGGSADHAAIKLSRRGQVSHFRFFPFEKLASAPFFPGHSLLVVHSGVEAPKSGRARDAFNQKVACYSMGVAMLRLLRPAWRERLRYVRDFDPRVLDASWGELMTALAQIPNRLTLREWRNDWESLLDPELRAAMEGVLASHHPPSAGYPIRPVFLFGLAEMQRARLAIECLASGDPTSFGRWMNCSHDGDRVHWTDEKARAEGEEIWKRGMVDADEQGGRRILAGVPGGYACSIEQVDRIVDRALALPGVLGAQIAGAGLGGCCMVLVTTDRAAALADELQGFAGGPVYICDSVGGACLLPPPR